jgi:hypothetical protein
MAAILLKTFGTERQFPGFQAACVEVAGFG